MNRRLAAYSGGDSGKAGLATVLRVPGTMNYKRHPQVDPVTLEITGSGPWTPEVLEQAIPPEMAPSRSPGSTEPYDGPEMDLAPYLERVEVLAEVADGLGKKFQIVCPWSHEHSGGDRSGTRIGQREGGGLWFHCDHEHCRGRTWQDFRNRVLHTNRMTIDRPGYTGAPMEVTIHRG